MNKICPFGENGVSPYSGSVWGKYIATYRGYAFDEGVRYKASSGGIISSISIFLLQNKLVDGVILTKGDEDVPYHCKTFCATTEEEVLSACGSRYSQSSPLMNILELVEAGKKYCVVGKPCDISTLKRYMDYNKKLINQIKYLLSFFCAGMPTDQANKKLLCELECPDCKDLRYRGNGWPGFTTAIDQQGNIHKIEYQKSWMDILGRDIRKCCKLCFDGIGEYADISCGDLWNLTEEKKPDFSENKGYNIIFARTQLGMELLSQMIKAGDIVAQPWGDKLEDLRYCQPNHYAKRTAIFGKVVALRLLLKNAPKYKLSRMIAYAKKNEIKLQIGAFIGTAKRCLKNKL